LGLSGQPDAWGDKAAIWILPAVAAFFDVMWAVLANYPHTFNYPVAITEENARVQYQLARSLSIARWREVNQMLDDVNKKLELAQVIAELDLQNSPLYVRRRERANKQLEALAEKMLAEKVGE